MARIAPIIWTDTPVCGTGIQMSKVYPAPRLRWLVWYGGKIVRFCDSPDQAFAWYFLIQAKGLGIINTLQDIASNLDRQDSVPFDELERKEEDEGSNHNGDVSDA